RNGCDYSCVQKSVLLRQVRPKGKTYLNEAGRDGAELCADQSHDCLFGEILSDYSFKVWIRRIHLSSPTHFRASSSDDRSSSIIHSTIESGRLPFLIKSS